ncbi:peroxisome membrane protein [Obelidium mucronatum]|nr:peroxisome membrane protein [Obelidium mucronatum]
MDSYANFLIKHAPVVGSLESLAESVTYILPGRFEHSEIVAEALHSFVSIISTYHDAVLSKHFGSKTKGGPSKFNLYVRHLMSLGPMYRVAAYLATLCDFTQVFSEMLAKDYVGEQFRWKVIAKIEVIKLLCRIVMFRKSKNRMLLGSHVPERDYDMATIQKEHNDRLLQNSTGSNSSFEQKSEVRGKHSGKMIPSISGDIKPKANANVTEQDVVSFLNKKASSVTEALLPIDLVSRLEGPGVVAEWIHMLRPIAYLVALRQYGAKSWNPWILSLIMEASSLGIHMNQSSLTALLNKRSEGNEARKSTFRKVLEKDELQRRLWLLCYYMLRDPCYSLFVKDRLNKFCESMAKKPIISLASGLLADYIPLWEGYYFLVNP